jgi:copper chaperone CopZ
VSVAIKKLEGVQSVNVSLNEGYADIKLKPTNKVTVEKVREVVRTNGFTPKDTQLRVAGKVVERGGKPALEVTGTDVVYLLTPAAKGGPELKADAAGKKVIVSGRVPESSKVNLNAPLSLEVLSLTVE